MGLPHRGSSIFCSAHSLPSLVSGRPAAPGTDAETEAPGRDQPEGLPEGQRDSGGASWDGNCLRGRQKEEPQGRAKALASLRGGPAEGPRFCRQKLEFVACSDDEAFSVLAGAHTQTLLEGALKFRRIAEVPAAPLAGKLSPGLLSTKVRLAWSSGLGFAPACLAGVSDRILSLPCTSVSPPVKWVEIRHHLRLGQPGSDALFDYQVD